MDNEQKKKIKIWRPKNIHLVNKENDIQFRGPLSYRHLRMIGWVFLAISQIAMILGFGERIYQHPGMYGAWPDILNVFYSLMTPLFLIAIFGIVLNAKDGYYRLIIMYSGLSILVYIGSIFAFEHYIVGFFALSDGYAIGQADGESLVHALFTNGFVAYNIFIDLLLCTLSAFFINYNPKKLFKGKRIAIFRSFIIFPIIYEIVSIILKVLSSLKIIELSVFIFPLLTTKAPAMFLVFISMALFMKYRERFFIRKGLTHQDYLRFQKTNVNSLHFSIFLSACIAIAALIDFIVFFILTFSMMLGEIPPDLTQAEYFERVALMVGSWGFGKCVYAIFLIPIIMFFDYQKTYKNNLIDIIIPFAGVALVAFVFIEGGYDVLRLRLAEIINEPDDPETPETIISSLKMLFMK